MFSDAKLAKNSRTAKTPLRRTHRFAFGVELDEIKAKKFGGAIEFNKNIEALPFQVDPQVYVEKLKDIISRYLLYAKGRIND